MSLVRPSFLMGADSGGGEEAGQGFLGKDRQVNY